MKNKILLLVLVLFCLSLCLVSCGESTPESSADTTKAQASTTPKTSSAAAAQVSPELLDITEDTTIQALAAKYNTTEANLRSLNEGFTGDTITKGSYFFVPVKK